MAYEIPSIAFNRGALGEIIENGKSGLLVSGPNVPEISAAIIRLLLDEQFARQLGESARRRIEQNFSTNQMVDEMLRVYNLLLEKTPATLARTTF
jgi:glycosyltransferase involved in cell wall biosynthesis